MIDEGVEVTPYGAIVSIYIDFMSACGERGAGTGVGRPSDGISTLTAGATTDCLSFARLSKMAVANVCASNADIAGGYIAERCPRDLPWPS